MDADRGAGSEVLGAGFWVFGTSNPELRTSGIEPSYGYPAGAFSHGSLELLSRLDYSGHIR